MLFFIILYIYIKYDIKNDKKINNYSLIIGLTILFNKLFKFLFVKCNNIKFIEKNEKISLKLFIVLFSIIFIGNLLYFIRFYTVIM